MTDAILLPFDLSAIRRKKLTVDFGGGNQSSNGGLLLRSAERKLGVCKRLADAMPDHRDASRIRHAMFEMVMARVCAIACGHEDAIDLDRLRHDPLMKVAVGRCPQSGAPLASQSTISRLENAPRKAEAARLTAALVDQAGATVKPRKQEDSSTSTMHSARRMTVSSLRSGTPITMSAVSRRCTSIVANGTPVVTICARRAPRRASRTLSLAELLCRSPW
jgi:Transposase DDE domain group 1